VTDTKPEEPAGINHLVLNARDIEASHRFYTEIVGFVQVGTLGPEHSAEMRFYASGGKHHDLALSQRSDTSGEPDEWSMFPPRHPVSHIAIAYPDRESFLRQVEHVQAKGVEIKVRGNHGMTHSAYIVDPDGNGIELLYELPKEVWEGDINAALNYFEPMATSGPESLTDDTDYVVFGSESSNG
jgi:catechol 2,3-dioxygenase